MESTCKARGLYTEDEDGLSPLMVAFSRSQVGVINFLSDFGCDQVFRNRDSKDFMDVAMDTDSEEIISLALQLRNDQLLLMAAKTGKVRAVELLYSKGARLSVKSDHGEDLLTVATLRGDVILVRKLLEFGALPIAQDHKGNTALHYAVISRNEEIFALLVALDCNAYNLGNNEELTPMDIAYRSGYMFD